jgi:hypothetical protein
MAMQRSPDRMMADVWRPGRRGFAVLALVVMAWMWSATPSASPSAPLAERLADAGYVWMPEIAPSGPVVIVVSLPAQLAYVYRNGVRIAVANVSTGRPGFDTPAGVYSILQKHREHFSNRYDNAPMPFMQRLSWDGVALHAGNVPGYPASHGCIRLPYPFAEKLFGLTSQGMIVVVADESLGGPRVAYPGLFAPVDPRTGAPRLEEPPLASDSFTWAPERASSGPVTIVLSAYDRDIVVMRDAVEIGRAPVRLDSGVVSGTQVYVLLRGAGDGMSRVVPGRPALRWMRVPLDQAAEQPQDALRQDIAAGRLSIPPAFARNVYDLLVPGTTLVVTDDPTQPGSPHADRALLQADQSSAGSAAAEQP